MANPAVIRVRDLRRYLDGFPDDAVVVRQIGDARYEGAYLDLNVAMAHLEEERGRDQDDEGDASIDDEAEPVDSEIEPGDDDSDHELDEARSLREQQERNIRNWENDQR